MSYNRDKFADYYEAEEEDREREYPTASQFAAGTEFATYTAYHMAPSYNYNGTTFAATPAGYRAQNSIRKSGSERDKYWVDDAPVQEDIEWSTVKVAVAAGEHRQTSAQTSTTGANCCHTPKPEDGG